MTLTAVGEVVRKRKKRNILSVEVGHTLPSSYTSTSSGRGHWSSEPFHHDAKGNSECMRSFSHYIFLTLSNPAHGKEEYDRRRKYIFLSQDIEETRISLGFEKANRAQD